MIQNPNEVETTILTVMNEENEPSELSIPPGGDNQDATGEASSSAGDVQGTDLKYGFDELCPVCGDKVSGYHYGLLTCESCKGFFKRTVQNKKVYSCVDNRSCHIDKSQRKRCPYCRFQKCLNVGMKLEAVRTDRMRGGRNKFGPMYKRDRALKQQALRQQQQMLATCQMRLANGIDPFSVTSGAEPPDIKPDPAFLMSVANSLGYGMNNNLSQPHTPTTSPTGSGIPSPTVSDNSPHDLRLSAPASTLSHSQGHINTNSQGMYTNTGNYFPSTGNMAPTGGYQSYYHAVPHPSNMPLLPQLVVDLKASALDEREMKNKLLSFVDSEFGTNDITSENYQSKLLQLLCRLSDQLLFLMVEWARTSVFFRELKVEDQMKLLQNCWSEILILDLAHRLLRQTWSGELILANGHRLSLDCLEDLGIPDIKDRILDIVRKMKELKIDDNEYTCLKFLILLNPDVSNIDCQEFVESCQEKVQAVLMEYCVNFYPNVKDKFSQVLLRLPDIKLASMCGEEFLYSKHLSGELPEHTLLMEMLHSKKK
ncbi:nuclear receptor subfamily 5 group A member 2-like isoform X1 [Ruditapes philippinarum]|uniref:nuclear receptor subfamily 5 group A member 2-like isoform X1 n=1 Tax=Ruditapes philippinarum TaxID=129788 RepID=UPI00295B6C81|nr:nuclear receptor subfamily 5 group A member 2-like isoform X1 [Ruditapes philippinarum]